eukprot:evm.model.scf_18.14 EVM.evm.TU.scf_18.14   scf_18:86380-87576(-)
MGALGYFAVAAAGVALAVLLDVIPVGLPYPAVGERAVDIPAGLLPVVASPLEGPYAPNKDLQATARLLRGAADGCESVAATPDGKTVIVIDKFGYARRGRVRDDPNDVPSVDLEEGLYAYTGPGRPGGAEIDAGGNLLVCDTLKGLLMVENGTRRLVVLANRVADDSPLDPGTEIRFANDLDVAADGTVYFSSSSDLRVAIDRHGAYDTMGGFMLDAFRGKPTGRLLAYDPVAHSARVLAKGIWFANGVALAGDGSFVAVAETMTLSVRRHWLKGPKAGQTDVLIDRLPGFPDGVALGEDGNFLIALVSRPSPLLRIFPLRPLRALMARVPPAWVPRPAPWGAVVRVSPAGEVVEALFDPEGRVVSGISGVREAGGRMFFGALESDRIGIYQPKRGVY